MSRPSEVRGIAPERLHTLYFLDTIRSFSPVFLDTEVDMTAVLRHRADSSSAGVRYSLVSYVLYTAARVLVAHPDANVALSRSPLRSRVARYSAAHGKLTLDRVLGGQRVVLAAVLPDLDQATLSEIQQRVEHYRHGDPADMPEFAGVRALHRLPRLIGSLAFRLRVRPLSQRADIFGTFAVTSLGHRPVDGFHSVGGTTITLGVGQVAERPAVREGQITIAPVMRLSLSFDHRAIDGAEAADVLADLKNALEQFADGHTPDRLATPATNLAGER